MKIPPELETPAPSVSGVGIVIDFRDTGQYSFAGVRTNPDGSQEEMLPPECMAIMARVLDSQMCAATMELKKQVGPKIQMARGPVMRG